eukprot:5073473-Heterocapsa_arctica.AAC.1
MTRALQEGRMATGDARSLRGKLLHQAAAYEGRVGRGQCFAFSAHIEAGGGQLSQAMRNNLLFHLALMEISPLRTVSVYCAMKPRIT